MQIIKNHNGSQTTCANNISNRCYYSNTYELKNLCYCFLEEARAHENRHLLFESLCFEPNSKTTIPQYT